MSHIARISVILVERQMNVSVNTGPNRSIHLHHPYRIE